MGFINEFFFGVVYNEQERSKNYRFKGGIPKYKFINL